mmetsp:Transcript_96804/g.273781  ORF Transcript_96804/g.273781 Transcript_96804/m.273781 type:complete len:205 (-) Transcript_96804:161-775(-)
MHNFSQTLGHLPGDLVLGRCVLGRPGDDQRGPRLVDEDGVYLVHDAEVERVLRAQGEVRLGGAHLVPQVVEAEFAIGHIGHVAAVGPLLHVAGHLALHDAHRQPQEPQRLPHPLGVAAREVVVHGDHVYALPGQRVQERGEDGHKRLSLSGAHLGDLAVVQRHSADELNVEVPQSEHAVGRLAYQRERHCQQALEGLAPLRPAA